VRHPFLLLIFIAGLLPVQAGCLSPNAVQWPSTYFSDRETQRRSAQVQDPYPDSSTGPEVGFRPLGFQEQRSEPQQVRDRYYSSFLKSHFGGSQPSPAQTSAAPMLGPGFSGQQYAGQPINGQPLNGQQYANPQYITPQYASPYYATPQYAGQQFPSQQFPSQQFSGQQFASPQIPGYGTPAPQVAAPVYGPVIAH